MGLLYEKAEATKQLRNLLGKDDAEFRHNQWEAISQVLSTVNLYKTRHEALKRKGFLYISATASGKSLTYQFPAIVHKIKTVVVSPLISLINDQVEQSNKLYKDIGILFIAPERFKNKKVINKINEIADLIVIDESHLISLWGNSFRPDYGLIGNILREKQK